MIDWIKIVKLDSLKMKLYLVVQWTKKKNIGATILVKVIKDDNATT